MPHIRRQSRVRVKRIMAEEEWDPAVLEQVRLRAGEIKRSRLILFWLSEMCRQSEAVFNQAMGDLPKFSQQELIDLIHELGPAAENRFLSYLA